MRKILKIIIPLMLVILIVNQNQIRALLTVKTSEEEAVETTESTIPNVVTEQPTEDYLISDSLYRWDEVHLTWATVKSTSKALVPAPTFTALKSSKNSNEPVVIDWQLLLDIEYQRKYFKEVEMEMYAPVFTEALKVLDDKEVIIEGFVIPFDETGELLALSANPFASCFFCGKASPASVISLYLKHKSLYKMDDYRKFRGVLELNYDDPKEYYYILHDAEPVK